MPWLEYNIHLRSQIHQDIIAILTDLLQPFVDSHRNFFNHWHYLFEPNVCGSSPCEIRLRFEGTPQHLRRIKRDLITEIGNFSRRTNLVMREDEPLGSHEGCHGTRNASYQGAVSENFGEDWLSIVEILQIGSESAIQILRLGARLAENQSIQPYVREVRHPYFLHLPANQLLVEP